MDFGNVSKKKNKSRKIIAFDEETVTKDNAVRILSESRSISKKNKRKISQDDLSTRLLLNENNGTERKNESNETVSDIQKSPDQFENNKSKRKSLNKGTILLNEHDTEEVKTATEVDQKKQKKRKQLSQVEKEESEKSDELNPEKPEIKQGESIRGQKRRNHAKLLEEKRLKTEMATQHNVFNYLSKWKHSRGEWRFEKLKQIWLQQNLFNPNKIPNEFWNIVTEYFSGSKGLIRNLILKDALNIIEKEENSDVQNANENYLLRLQRARDIVQNLQE